MNDGLLNKKVDNSRIAEKYLNKYIIDLQLHLNLSDSQVLQILNTFIHSFKHKNREINPKIEKKWWQILKKNITMKNINTTK